MVAQGNPQHRTNCLQVGSLQLPRGARQLDGAVKRRRGQRQLRVGQTGLQHLFVKSRVVGGDERHAVKKRSNGRPKRSKVRSRLDVFSRNPVYPAVFKVVFGRTDQVVCVVDNSASLYPHQPDRAGAVGPAVRGLKVERDKWRQDGRQAGR